MGFITMRWSPFLRNYVFGTFSIRIEAANPRNRLQKSNLVIPWKISMEPTNHPFRKENDLPNLHDYPCESSGVYDGFL